MGDFIVLKAQDGVGIEVKTSSLRISDMLYTMVQEDNDDCEAINNVQEITIPNMESFTISKVVEFLEYYDANPMNTIPTPIPWPTRLPDVVEPRYYAHFILSLPLTEVLKLLRAADYFIIPALIDLCCARLGRLFISKTPQEIEALVLSENSHSHIDLSPLFESIQWSVTASPEYVHNANDSTEAEPVAMHQQMVIEQTLWETVHKIERCK